MFFTESGRAYVEKVYEIPEMGRAAKGRSIANILELRPDEKIAATIRIQSKKSGVGPNAVDQTWDENLHIVFASQSGIVKKSNLSDYRNVRKGGIIAIQIEKGDRLIDAKLTSGNNELVLITKEGMSLRKGAKLHAVALVVSQAEEEEAQTAEAPAPKKAQKK